MDVKNHFSRNKFQLVAVLLPISILGGRLSKRKQRFLASPLDIGEAVVDGLIQRMDMEKQIRLFVDLTFGRGISCESYIALYTRQEIIQLGFCVEKAHGR